MKKNVKALILSLLATLAIGSMAACGGGSDDNTSTPNSDITSQNPGTSEEPGVSEEPGTSEEEEDITISLTATESVKRFETVQLEATVKGTPGKLTWTSSNPAVATVDENGLVSALTVGETVITATVEGVSATCTVTVTETDIPHEIEVSLDEISVFEGKTSEEVTVDVSFGGEVLDGDFEYSWFVDGEEGVVDFVASEDGKSVTFTGLKPGSVTVIVETNARGYEISKEIIVTVRENSYALGISHEDIVPVDNGYAVDLTLGNDDTSSVTFGDAYLAINGVASEDKLAVAWTLDNDNVTFADGTITAQKKGTSVLTGTAEYLGKTLTLTLTVTVNKGAVTLADTDTIEAARSTTFTVPASVDMGEVEKIYFGDIVVFDKANGVSSIDGNVVTFNDKTSLPVKDEDLGLGKELTIETNLIVYTMSVDVYTMIIDTVEELDMWQEVAAENAVKAGICIEAQKGLVTNGYFLLGDNIEYNKAWRPYKKYGELWALCYQNPNIWIDQSTYKAGTAPAEGNRVEGTIVADWGNGGMTGFRGIFDGQGHYINGMQTANLGDDGYNAFIVTLGGGTVRNVAFTNVSIGKACNSVVDRGNGLIEDVYVQVAAMESGLAKSDGTIAYTWGLLRGGSGSNKHGLNNTIIDYSAVDLSNLELAYLGCDITSEVLTGVYVVGVPASYTGPIWNNEGVGRHQIGCYATFADLLAVSDANALVSEWNTDMWSVGAGHVVAKSVLDFYKGAVAITNTETKLPAGTSLMLTTDKFYATTIFSVKEAIEGVSIANGVLTVDAEAEEGATFTVVATSSVDGTSVEKTFTIDKRLEYVTATETVDVDLGVYLNGTTVVTAESASVALAEIYETYLKGNAVTVKYGEEVVYEGTIDGDNWTMPLDKFAASCSGKDAIVFYCFTEEKNIIITLPVNFVQGTIELNSENVANPTDLNAILASDPYANYVLTSDLNMKGYRLVGMKEFYGTLDGNGHVIYNTLLDESSLVKVDGNGVYNPTFIMYNYGTIKNIGFKLDKLTRARGGRPRGIAYTNYGTVENVYLDVTFVEEQLTASDITYYTTGALVGYNEGTVKNALVNVNLAAGAVVLEKTTAAVVYENKKGTVENVYAINNGNTTVVTVMKGVEEGAFVPYTAWTEVTGEVFASLGSLWRKDGAVVYFGSYIIHDATVREEVEEAVLADANKVATLTNAAFTVGSTWNVDVNGEASEVTISEEGKLAVSLASVTLNKGYLAVVTVKSAEQEIRYTNVVVPTYITTADELKALGVGNNRTNTSDIEGYYVLANDITFEHAEDGSDIVTAGYPAGGDYYFKATFDGNGYALKNMRVSDGGIFGLMRGATVKNLKLENVYLTNNPPKGVSKQDGGYSSILAYAAPSSTFENITMTIASAPNAWSWKRDSLLVCSGSWGAATFRNITIDASYLSLNTLLGISHNSNGNNVYENVVIKAADYVAIGYTADSYAGGVQNTAALMTEFPAGVTFVKVTYAEVPNAIKAINSVPNVKYLSDNETALGFTAGTHVYEVTTNNQWSDRISIPADESYDYVEFDVVFTKEIGNATAWPAPAGGGTYGSFGVYSGGAIFSNDAQTKLRTIQIFKANGDTFKAQSGDKFAANVKYTFRFGFNESESIAAFQFGTSTNQTYYISNARFGNLDSERVYDSSTGALHAYYEGDVTALGFAAGTKVTSVEIANGWSNRVRLNADINYDYVEFQFSVNKAVGSYSLWAYGNDGKILTGNYNVYAAGGSAASGAVERKIAVTDVNGNAVTAIAANTVYVVRVYLDDTASSLAFSTFSTSAEDPVTISFGAISYGNDVVEGI